MQKEECIYSQKEYNIYKNKNIENVFKIEIKNTNIDIVFPFLTALKKTKLLTGLITNNQNNEISFQATSVIPLKEYLKINNFSYEKTLEFISSIYNQLNNLYYQGYSFYGLDLESIIIINNSIFLQISLDYLVPLNKSTNLISIYQPYSKNIFISQELYNQSSLPIFIPLQTIYISLANLCIYLLFKIQIQIQIQNENYNSEYKILLKPIEGTKLYWFLLRIIESQTLLYI